MEPTHPWIAAPIDTPPVLPVADPDPTNYPIMACIRGHQERSMDLHCSVCHGALLEPAAARRRAAELAESGRASRIVNSKGTAEDYAWALDNKETFFLAFLQSVGRTCNHTDPMRLAYMRNFLNWLRDSAGTDIQADHQSLVDHFQSIVSKGNHTESNRIRRILGGTGTDEDYTWAICAPDVFYDAFFRTIGRDTPVGEQRLTGLRDVLAKLQSGRRIVPEKHKSLIDIFARRVRTAQLAKQRNDRLRRIRQSCRTAIR